MSLVLLQRRRELNQRKLAALAFLAEQAEVDEWPERLDGLMRRPEALANDGLVRTVVQEVVQEVALKGELPRLGQLGVVSVIPAKETKEPAAEARPAPIDPDNGGQKPSKARPAASTAKGEE